MKKFYIILLVLSCSKVAGQTNLYPSSGNVKIFAGDEAWAEGVAIVKASGWSGIRLARNNPSGGNFSGNWAVGYNAGTGDDFSISNNYAGTQYDGIFHISTSTRNVGVGTTSPQGKFTIAQPGNGWNDGLRINRDASNYLTLTEDISDVRLKNWGSGGIRFFTSAAESVTIVNNGHVGIGTTTPDQKLTVNGTIHSKEIKVDLSVPAPDYVFEKEYKLPSLEEIETYIDENKHLPDVPSAKEMETHGMQLGEMNMTLLKKIEELTLYMIDAKKEIEELKRENREIKNLILK